MRQGSVEPVMTLLFYIERFANAVTVMEVHLDHVRETVLLPELAIFSSQILLTLAQLADAVEQETMSPPLSDLAATLQSLRSHLRALRIDRILEFEVDRVADRHDLPLRQAVMADRILGLKSDQIVRRLTAIHAAFA